MKMTKINIKNLFLGLVFAGTASLVNAQTTKTDTATSTTTTATTAQTGDTSIEGLKKQIEANPKDTDALVKLASAYQDASDWTNAVDTWKKISVLLPDWAPSYYSQAYAYQSAKDDANAKLAYEKYVAAVKPAEVEQNKKNLAYAYFYLAFSEQKTDPGKAKQHIAKSLEYDPNNQDAIKLSKALNS
ncbi:tetratricopeptide repeat protein [Chryseobacterium kwangjuense]|uniref:Tetratricopeptide repeat protein n=1 Tax=Chryseobacterium kwangjuense TaxID=267125 RepID=A0ABW9JYM3_9FLAO